MIRESRLKKHFTQKDLAQKLKTNQSYISKLENKSINNFNFKYINELAKILDLDLKELIDWLLS